MFLNDPGVADLLDASDVVEIKSCPTWKRSDSDWGDNGRRPGYRPARSPLQNHPGRLPGRTL
jgi:hypothetical protein